MITLHRNLHFDRWKFSLERVAELLRRIESESAAYGLRYKDGALYVRDGRIGELPSIQIVIDKLLQQEPHMPLMASVEWEKPNPMGGNLKVSINWAMQTIECVLSGGAGLPVFGLFDQVPIPTPPPDVSFEKIDQKLREFEGRINQRLQLQVEEAGTAVQTEIQSKTAELNSLTEQAKAVAQTAEAAQAQLSTLLEKGAVAHHARVFEEEAITFQQTSERWLVAAVILLVVLVIVTGSFIYNSLHPQIPPNTAPELLPSVMWTALFARAALFSVLVTAFAASLRQYSAARHNWIVTRHRVNALQSYQAFVAAAGDGESASAMLTHAMSLIFSVQDTGHAKSRGDGGSPTILVELIKLLGGQPRH